MLCELHIENIAVIEKADIEFGEGLNVLTGETGAGKSIVIDSLQAALGARTSRSLVRTGADRAAVTAVFSSSDAEPWLAENGIEPEDTVIIRRRISADGRSTAAVNGEPVSLSQLKNLGSLLLDIHGQNDGRQLMDESSHRAFLDSFAGLDGELSQYGRLYSEWKRKEAELRSLERGEEDKLRRIEELERQISELERAEIREGEEDALLSRRDILHNSERLTEYLDGAYSLLYELDESASNRVAEASGLVTRAVAFAPELREASEELSTAAAAIEDAAERIRDFAESLDFSPEEYDALEARLSLLRRLQKKYKTDEAGLIKLLGEAKDELAALGQSDARREQLSYELDKLQGEVYNSAKKLSEKRHNAAKILKERIESGLRSLSMPSVRFETELLPVPGSPGFDSFGMDSVRFLISANAGEEPDRLSRIASGGELSRIMLVMKETLSERFGAEAMVFDEIDTGVSGIAAQRVGEKLSRLSRKKQVICVTHLAQIAALADSHFKIEKSERDGRTFTAVTPLDYEGRARELARLHGGDVITETTLRGAREQLDAAESYKRG